MKQIFYFLTISCFSIFIGSQITEGVLLVPYWKTLSSTEFYDYYNEFGPSINSFYTYLTITAIILPLLVCIYCYYIKSPALKFSIISSFFAILVIAVFYLYFKDMNQQFYQAALNANQLKSELDTWGNWHWLRVLFEVLSLNFLIIAIIILNHNESSSVIKQII